MGDILDILDDGPGKVTARAAAGQVVGIPMEDSRQELFRAGLSGFGGRE
jgi:hypothetical protein